MSKPLRSRLTLLHWIALVSVLTVAVLGAGYWGVSRILARQFPDVSRLKTEYPVVTYNGRKKPFTVKLQKGRPPGWTNYGEISKYAVGAVIVSEDASFFSHKGYDPEALRLAVKEDLAEGRFARGASTITMQVVKNVFLTQEKTITRKIREFFLAIRMDEQVSKRKILETYFNIAEWGEGIFGIRRASQYYFQKGPSELTPKEAAFLAMLLPSPKRYSQSFRAKQLSRYASRTIDKTLIRMAKGRWMPAEMLEYERATPLSFEIVTTEPPPVEPPEEDEVMTEENTTPVTEETAPTTPDDSVENSSDETPITEETVPESLSEEILPETAPEG